MGTFACHMLVRGTFLFMLGVLFTIVFKILQFQRNFHFLASQAVQNMMCSTLWVPTICGVACVLVGLVYPCIDRKLGEKQSFNTEWASVMRCTAFFMGINHASAKLSFDSYEQLALILGAMSLALWWYFDRTRRGFGLGMGSAILSVLTAQLLVDNGICSCTENDYLFIRSWLPCAFFSGGITVGNIGRQLAVNDYSVDNTIAKPHQN